MKNEMRKRRRGIYVLRLGFFFVSFFQAGEEKVGK